MNANTTYLVNLLIRFMSDKESWTGTPGELLDALHDQLGVRLVDPRYPWALRFEVLGASLALSNRGVLVVNHDCKPISRLHLSRFT